MDFQYQYLPQSIIIVFIHKHFNLYISDSDSLNKQYKSIMTWRQNTGLNGIKTIQNESVGEITKLRLQNTRLKIQLQNIRKEQQPRNGQLSKMVLKIQENKQREIKIKNQLTKIGVLINCQELHKINQISQLLDAIEKKVVENRDITNHMERELEKYHNQFSNLNSNNEKNQVNSRQIQILQRKMDIKEQENKQLHIKNNLFLQQMKKLRLDLQKKDSLLGQLSHKISQLEIQKKDVESQIRNMRTSSQSIQSEVIKKQCQQLINQINIRDDDYLKSYLMKNHRYQNSTTNSVTRKNKYDFIFQD